VRAATALLVALAACASPSAGTGETASTGGDTGPTSAATDAASTSAPSPTTTGDPAPATTSTSSAASDDTADDPPATTASDDTTATTGDPAPLRVVLVGIDGLGAAYIPAIDTPNLDAIVAAGPHSMRMQNALPTMSAPNWMSMIAGAGPDQHGVTSNEWAPGDSQPTPTMFAVVRAHRPAATIGVFHDWDGFSALVEPGVPDIIDSPGDEQETMDAAIAWYTANQPDLLFVHLDLVDHAGHFHGWGGPDYVAAGEKADALVGQLLAAVDAAGLADETVFLVSADHGGDGLSHGADTSLERPIPLIARGPGLASTVITRELRVWDIAATVVALQGVEPPADWIASPIVEITGGPLPPDPAAALTLQEVSEYTWVYDDTGSGAFTDGSIWRPVVPPGFFALGDVAVAGHDPPDFATLVVADDPEALRPPVAYEQIWNDTASLGLHDVAVWNPIPPLGYTCLGSVAVGDHETPPAADLVRCVHDSHLVPGDRTLTWTDAGSLALQDVGLWTCIPGPDGGQAVRSFITRRHHEDPGSNRCRSLLARGP
jgi:hypothetical protein